MAKNESKVIKTEDKNKQQKPVQKVAPKKVVTRKETPIEEKEVEVLEPETKKTTFTTPTPKFGRLSPDGMVELTKQLKEMYIDKDTPEAPHMLAAIRIQHAYLLNISMAQISEDAPILGMKIHTSELETLKLGAEALKVNITKALPVPDDKEQLEIEFDKNTVPAAVTEQLAKEKESGEKELDMNPDVVYTAAELKERLLHLLNKNNSRSTNIIDAINWYKKNLVSPQIIQRNNYVVANSLTEDEAKRNADPGFIELTKTLNVLQNTKNVDIFNQILDLLGDDIPSMVQGVCKSIWNKYSSFDTILPMHFFIKNITKDWTDEEIRDFAQFVVVMEASKMEGPDVKDVTFLQNAKQPFVDELVDKILKEFSSKGACSEANIIRNNFNKFVCVKRVPQKERIGSVLQSLFNLYADPKATETERLSKYKDLSAYSQDDVVEESDEKKN